MNIIDLSKLAGYHDPTLKIGVNCSGNTYCQLWDGGDVKLCVEGHDETEAVTAARGEIEDRLIEQRAELRHKTKMITSALGDEA